jgi:hypothetical protein
MVFGSSLSHHETNHHKDHQRYWDVHLERSRNTSWFPTTNFIPKEKGGLNLIAPGLKAESLLIANFLKHSSENPFIAQFITSNNPSNLQSFSNIFFLKQVLLELFYIPVTHLQTPVTP